MEEKILTNKIQEIIFTGNPVLSINERLDEIKYNKNKKKLYFNTDILILISLALVLFGGLFILLFPERTNFWASVLLITGVAFGVLIYNIIYRKYELDPKYEKFVIEENELQKKLDFYNICITPVMIIKRIKISKGFNTSSGIYSNPYATIIYNEGIPFNNTEKEIKLPLILKIAEQNSVNYNKLIINFDDFTITKYFTSEESKCDEAIFNTFSLNEAEIIKENKK